MERTLLLLPLFILSLPLLAQAPGKPKAEPRAQAKAEPAAKGHAAPASAATPEPLSANQGINPDDLMMVHATTYHPTLLRDPFSTPTDAEQSNKGDSVEDIAIKGRVVSKGKAMAVVSDARGNIRLLSPGFRFRDGELIAVDEKAVTFHQWDASGTNTKAYRTVVKTFKREEGKR